MGAASKRILPDLSALSECQYRIFSGECFLTNGNCTRKNNETDCKRSSRVGVETFWGAQLEEYYRCDDDSNIWKFGVV